MARSPPAAGASPNALATVFHHRWAVPVLAELHRGRGAKFVTLVNRLGVGRDTLSRTLKALDEQGWATRNPGHGHPMRPEYVLTAAGRPLGKASEGLHDVLVEMDFLRLGLQKWSLPVLAAIGNKPRRFQDLSGALPDATARSLAQSLKTLVEAGLVSRALLDDYPPRPMYNLTSDGTALLAEVAGVATALHKARG